MIGFIGLGNMACAIISGLVKKQDDYDIYGFDIDNNKNINAQQKYKINICCSVEEVLNKSKYIFLAVKPNVYSELYPIIENVLTNEKVIISMAAGIEIKEIVQAINCSKIVRIMPNTPSLIGKGVVAMTYKNLDTTEFEDVKQVLFSLGDVYIIEEKYMDIFSSISGSGPAFISIIVESMIDAGVLLGLNKTVASEVVNKTVLGTVELMLSENIDPSQLKYLVSSPGGTTIEGVRTMEEKGVRTSIIETIINTYKKNKNINFIR